ncbi:MAG: hypothetical protein MK081_07495 [Flavobacteriales bacterium]|nr:hypothetical protein [Flavobacteriales bacterium]
MTAANTSIIKTVLSIITLMPMLMLGQSELQAGVVYQGGERISISQIGLTFQVPVGWIGALPEASEAFILEPSNGGSTAFILIDDYSYESLTTDLNNPLPIEAWSGIQPKGKAQRKGDMVCNNFSTYGLGDFDAYASAKPGSHGTGFGVVLIAPPSSIQSQVPAMDQMVAQAQLNAPATNSTTSNANTTTAAGSGEWYNYMRGQYLRYMKTANGYSESCHMWLCPDGSFAYSGSDSYLSGGYADFSYAGDSGEQYGRWTVQGAVLTLNFEDGRQWNYQLSMDDEGLYLDGYRWFRVDNERCQ